ncbi:hypothetical protein SV7mr_05610 [Stieleria bergensis]|uniref:Uncharacterized protein n=2 Tax=Stieleria bergensis TaxID=2528025 RepID=A0A517SPM7_9BACT|nr:hypothetical protein SV7mr_05610 [Planctomycetes bacterium SV_7m_r]
MIINHHTHTRQSNCPQPQGPRSRRGAIMFCVLACLGVSLAIVTLMVRGAVSERRATRRRHQMNQTERLLDAGILRAVQQRQQNPSYQGESWTVKLPEPQADQPASIQIRIENGVTHVTAQLGERPSITSKSFQFKTSESE